ncbi:uncharacterized protein [Diadema antillarum]|uniref:uncharacterized protein n=1 Tax=Diadema antillarum TaxID=105358 RepID=UPI003A85B0F3
MEQHDDEINELREQNAAYRPGSTFRSSRQRPMMPPRHLLVAVLGPTGVGKSALINSMFYVMGHGWECRAPEANATQPSATREPTPYDVASGIKFIDNRGMREFGGGFMVDLARELGDVFAGQWEWNRQFILDLVAGIERAWTGEGTCHLHCAVLVLSAVNFNITVQDMKILIDKLRKLTGEPPIVVITHRDHPDVSHHVIRDFKAGLQENRIDYVFELENYTASDHMFDPEKHLAVLRLLRQCTVVGDRVIKNLEEGPKKRCNIL